MDHDGGAAAEAIWLAEASGFGLRPAELSWAGPANRRIVTLSVTAAQRRMCELLGDPPTEIRQSSVKVAQRSILAAFKDTSLPVTSPAAARKVLIRHAMPVAEQRIPAERWHLGVEGRAAARSMHGPDRALPAGTRDCFRLSSSGLSVDFLMIFLRDAAR